MAPSLRSIVLALALLPSNAEERVIKLDKGTIALSTRGATAFRARFVLDGASDSPIDTPMVSPNDADATWTAADTATGTGITSAIGSVLVSPDGELVLFDSAGVELTRSSAVGGDDGPCAAAVGTDVTSATNVADPLTVDDAEACCDACAESDECTNWIFGHGDPAGDCWLVKDVQGTKAASGRTLGGADVPTGDALTLSTANASLLYGRGAGPGDASALTATSVAPMVENRMTYVPHYYAAADGYAALGVVPTTSGDGKTNYFAASYDASAGDAVTWTFGTGNDAAPFELYLMPAADLDAGTEAFMQLTGTAPVPPLYAFGFIASRWGWENESYIEGVLDAFRDGAYPIDAFICDFGWFTNVSDYDFQPAGEPWYDDFGFAAATFPEPAAQLARYQDELHFRMGGIRKPRLGNTALLDYARAQGWVLPGGERRLAGAKDDSAEHTPDLGYAEQRNLDYSIAAARDWYVEQQAHYLTDGVSFFWNDEGETDYFTFHWWNVAQLATLRNVSADARFFSINRAWTPGAARTGATAWTGDINPTWDDLAGTPGMVLNWALAGMPYVTCDIGGFTGETTATLLTRWMQLGAVLPVMRVHSTKDATPHFPWLWGEPYASEMRAALDLRYALVPYHYSLAHRAARTGRPALRPMAASFGDDATAAPLTAQFLDGELLAAPVLTEDGTKRVYLPAGTWFVFNDTSGAAPLVGPQTIEGAAELSELPLFAPAGAVVPLAPPMQYTDALLEGDAAALIVYVYGGADGIFTLVEDDGATQGAATRATTMKWDDAGRTLTLAVDTEAGAATWFESAVVTLFDASGARSSLPIALEDGATVTFAAAALTKA